MMLFLFLRTGAGSSKSGKVMNSKKVYPPFFRFVSVPWSHLQYLNTYRFLDTPPPLPKRHGEQESLYLASVMQPLFPVLFFSTLFERNYEQFA